ncbi:hypothetical protein Tco_0521662, partial [Tanacetum coccineum]
MSNHEQPTPSHPKSDVQNTVGTNKQTPQGSARTTSAVDLEGRRNKRILSLGQCNQEDRGTLAAR